MPHKPVLTSMVLLTASLVLTSAWRVSAQGPARLHPGNVPERPITVDARYGCTSYAGTTQASQTILGFRADASLEQMAADIVRYSGLRRNFVVTQGAVPNAAAMVHGSDRHIIVNPSFLANLQEVTATPWGAYSVMAHEIGHHLQGHTIQPGGSRPAIELEADEFSGFILARMGASLEEATAAMNRLGSETGSASHPGRRDRLEAIRTGWTNGRALDQPGSAENVPTPEPRPQPMPRPMPQPMPQPAPRPAPAPVAASVCSTSFGMCPMMVAIPQGSPCSCMTQFGTFPGVAY